jgi:adenosine deaminase
VRDLARLPKAHLHLHLDGAIRRGTLEELAGAAGTVAPMPTRYGSFAAFEQTITAAAAVLRGEPDVQRVVTEIAFDAASDGAVWVELSVWPGLFAGRLGPDEDAIEVLLAAAAEASAPSGV